MSTCTIVSVLPGGIACKIGQHWPTHKQLKEGNRQYGSENYNTNGDERSYQLSHVWRQWPEVVPDQDPQNVDKQVCWIISQFNAVYLSTWRNFSQVTMNYKPSAFKYSEDDVASAYLCTAGTVHTATSRRCGSSSQGPAAGTSHGTSPAGLQVQHRKQAQPVTYTTTWLVAVMFWHVLKFNEI